jgi:hypothetical protein
MNLKAHIDILKRLTDRTISTTGRRHRPLDLLYWLAGARQATLNQLPESERERIAILGSSVLIPTLLAFFGMYLYASSRFDSSRPIVTLLIALVWAFIIMNVDRILLATYRPFQSRQRRAIQVCFRVGLAAVISVAIAFPFCLEQYQGAIRERLQGEYRQRLYDLQLKERSEREAIESRDAAVLKGLREQLAQERSAGPVEPKLFAEELAKKTVQQRDDSVRSHREALEQEAAAALAEWKRISAQMREVEQDLKDEGRGRLAAERGGTGKPGQGAKYKELTRDLGVLTQAEQSARQRYQQLLGRAAAAQPADPPTEVLPTLDADRQAALMTEATERKERIDRLTQALTRAETERDEHMASHRLRFDPALKSYHAKAEGSFDPMEETIGLFKVIFVPEANSDGLNTIVQQYKWMAALFQFTIVFGTLFLLDLIAILSKVMSRPGPYDVLIEFPELVAGRNLEALRREYGAQAEAWADGVRAGGPLAAQEGIDLRNTEAIARLLLRVHGPTPGNPQANEHQSEQ